MNKTYSAADLKFLNLLSEKFPTIADATTEIINLEAILNLPKGISLRTFTVNTRLSATC